MDTLQIDKEGYFEIPQKFNDLQREKRKMIVIKTRGGTTIYHPRERFWDYSEKK